MGKNICEVGDYVEISTSEKNFKGCLIPSVNKDVYVLKLDSGYNVGINKSKVKKISIINKFQAKKENLPKIVHKKSLPTISILHTGGTIASKIDYRTGGVIASFSEEDFLAKFPEVNELANIKSTFISHIMSEDMRFSHYKKIGEAIVNEIKNGVKGIIIGHGTDTLAVTSAALAFMFENLPIPVILVGSQRSLDRGSSDAPMNVLCALEFIIKTDFKGVAICMHESMSDESCLILPACKTRKMHTSRRDAFKVINDKPIARVNYKTKKIEFLKEYNKRSNGKLIFKPNFEDKVAIIKTYPNMFPDLIESLTKNKYKGLILEASGIGQAPTNIKENLPNYNALKKFIDSGGTVVLTSQCIFGKVHPFIYANCRRLFDIGIIFGEDMLTETAFIKLAWLLSNFKKEQVKDLISKNLAGEINEKITGKEFLE